MGVNWGVSGCAGQIFAITVRDVLSSLGVTEALGEAKINNVDVVLLFADSNEEVVRFDITMEEMPWMHELNTLKLWEKRG